jgi:hypothetical protein
MASRARSHFPSRPPNVDTGARARVPIDRYDAGDGSNAKVELQLLLLCGRVGLACVTPLISLRSRARLTGEPQRRPLGFSPRRMQRYELIVRKHDPRRVALLDSDHGSPPTTGPPAFCRSCACDNRAPNHWAIDPKSCPGERVPRDGCHGPIWHNAAFDAPIRCLARAPIGSYGAMQTGPSPPPSVRETKCGLARSAAFKSRRTEISLRHRPHFAMLVTAPIGRSVSTIRGWLPQVRDSSTGERVHRKGDDNQQHGKRKDERTNGQHPK